MAWVLIASHVSRLLSCCLTLTAVTHPHPSRLPEPLRAVNLRQHGRRRRSVVAGMNHNQPPRRFTGDPIAAGLALTRDWGRDDGTRPPMAQPLVATPPATVHCQGPARPSESLHQADGHNYLTCVDSTRRDALIDMHKSLTQRRIDDETRVAVFPARRRPGCGRASTPVPTSRLHRRSQGRSPGCHRYGTAKERVSKRTHNFGIYG
jgi:hypothetical protein